VLKTSNAERLLFNLDALLMQLRSSRSLAVHLQQQHEDLAWAEAAAQVWRELKIPDSITLYMMQQQQGHCRNVQDSHFTIAAAHA
jgi:hypothetical protein